MGPWMKRRARLPAPVLLEDLRARDVRGHEVRGELHLPEVEAQASAVVETSSVLARPGTPTKRQ